MLVMMMPMMLISEVGHGRGRVVGGVGRGSSGSGQGVGVRGVVSQSWRGANDRRRRRSATARDAGRVMVERALIVLLMMMVGHVVHGPGGVRAGVHPVVMMMAGRRGMGVRMMRRAEVRVALMELLVHLHLRWFGVLSAGRGASRGAR